MYLQNFLPFDVMCCSWTWYLACDMQFYVLFLAILFVYVWSRRAGSIVYVAVATFSLSLSQYAYVANDVTFRQVCGRQECVPRIEFNVAAASKSGIMCSLPYI